MSSSVQEMIQEANRRASLGRQKVYAKKAVVKSTELELIALLRERVQDTLDCFYRTPAELPRVMKDLRQCDAVVGKRVLEIAKGKRA